MDINVLQLSFWILAVVYLVAAFVAVLKKGKESEFMTKKQVVLLKVTAAVINLAFCAVMIVLSIYHDTMAGTIGGVLFAILTGFAVSEARQKGSMWQAVGYLLVLVLIVAGLLQQ